MIGRMILHYRILRRLGVGGMGEVYLARNTKTNRLVALKILPAELARDPDRVRRFQEEAKAASRLDHPNILSVYDAGQDGDLHFIVTEYIDGENVQERLARAPLTLAEALRIAEKVADALTAAHRAGIIHLDLKLSNIMLGKKGLVKVVDWGVAKVTAAASPSPGSEGETVRMSAPGAPMATPAYASPEQLRGDEADARSDLFSLGVCLHEMISGQSPFRRRTFVGTIDAVLHDEPSPLSESVPEGVRAVVRRALQKTPEARYQAAYEFRRCVRAARRALPLSAAGAGRALASGLARRAARLPAAARAARRPMTRRRAITIVASLVLALGSATVIWYRVIQPRRLVAHGREFMKQRTGDSLRQARSSCERALSYNRSYAQAHICLADVHALREEYEAAPSGVTLPVAEAHAREGIKIKPNSGEAHASLAYVHTKMKKWTEAERSFRRSIDLNPYYPRARHWFCMYLRIVGRHDEALAQIKIGRDLDPADQIIRVNLIISYLMVGQVEQAIREGEELLDLNPKFWGARAWVAVALTERGDKGRSDAISDMDAAVEHSKRSHTLLANFGYILAIYGEVGRAESILTELKELHRQGKAIGQDMAKVCVGLGRLDEAFYWLEEDFKVASGDLPNISWHPTFKRVRGHPRYNDLLRRLNLPAGADIPVKGDESNLADARGAGGGLPLVKASAP